MHELRGDIMAVIRSLVIGVPDALRDFLSRHGLMFRFRIFSGADLRRATFP